MKLLARVLVVVALTGWAGSTLATPILTFTGGVAIDPDADTTGGWQFLVSSEILVDGLGFWDEDSDGLGDSHDVGLWTLAGDLLASTTVTNSGAVEANGAGPGRWLFSDISQLVLAPGNYVLGAAFLNGRIDSGRDTGVVGSTATTVAGVTFVNARQQFDPGLVFPDEIIPVNDGVFGANLRLAAAPVPAPATILLIALGIAGLGWRRH